MDSFFEIIKAIFEKLKIKEIIFVVTIICGCILFVPVRYLSLIGLDYFQEKHKSTVGLLFLFCSIFCVIWVIQYIINVMKNIVNSEEKVLKRLTRGYLKRNISPQEQEFLINHFYDFSRNEFKLSASVSMSNGCVSPLENSYVIYRGASVGHSVYGWAYNMQPYARELLNDAIKKKKIRITPTKTGFSVFWKL